MSDDEHPLTRRDAAAPPPDLDKVWSLLRELIWAGQHESPNHAVMVNEQFRAGGKVLEVDCSVMAAWLLTTLGLATLGDLRDERGIRKCAASLIRPAQQVIRIDKRLLRKVLRSIYNVGERKDRSEMRDTLFAGCVTMGVAIAQQDTGIVAVESYRDQCIAWCTEQWPATAAMQLRLP